MPRARTGYVYYDTDHKCWRVRLEYTDATGRQKTLRRRPATNTRQAAEDLRVELLSNLRNPPSLFPNIEYLPKTFSQLADYYEQEYVHEARYVGDRKVSGLRTAYNVRSYLSTLRDHFGDSPLPLSHEDVRRFKEHRLSVPTVKDKQRTIASVNRELEVLRRLLNVAISAGWAATTPFSHGRLILKSDERQRERILSAEEEGRLLACCGPGKRGMRLRAIIITALDTGLRRNELFTLTWMDVNFGAGKMTVSERNSKTAKRRQVPMSGRVELVLSQLCVGRQPYDLVFGILSSVKKAFATARSAAGLDDLRFHDLRHTFCSRLVRGGMAPAEAARLSGHDQLDTFYRYVNTDDDTLFRARKILDQSH